jgi:hypothetical protein
MRSATCVRAGTLSCADQGMRQNKRLPRARARVGAARCLTTTASYFSMCSLTSSISNTMSYGTPASASSTLSCPGIRPATGWMPNSTWCVCVCVWRQRCGRCRVCVCVCGGQRKARGRINASVPALTTASCHASHAARAPPPPRAPHLHALLLQHLCELCDAVLRVGDSQPIPGHKQHAARRRQRLDDLWDGDLLVCARHSHCGAARAGAVACCGLCMCVLVSGRGLRGGGGGGGMRVCGRG